jgi:hypothetical protein
LPLLLAHHPFRQAIQIILINLYPIKIFVNYAYFSQGNFCLWPMGSQGWESQTAQKRCLNISKNYSLVQFHVNVELE